MVYSPEEHRRRKENKDRTCGDVLHLLNSSELDDRLLEMIPTDVLPIAGTVFEIRAAFELENRSPKRLDFYDGDLERLRSLVSGSSLDWVRDISTALVVHELAAKKLEDKRDVDGIIGHADKEYRALSDSRSVLRTCEGSFLPVVNNVGMYTVQLLILGTYMNFIARQKWDRVAEIYKHELPTLEEVRTISEREVLKPGLETAVDPGYVTEYAKSARERSAIDKCIKNVRRGDVIHVFPTSGSKLHSTLEQVFSGFNSKQKVQLHGLILDNAGDGNIRVVSPYITGLERVLRRSESIIPEDGLVITSEDVDEIIHEDAENYVPFCTGGKLSLGETVYYYGISPDGISMRYDAEILGYSGGFVLVLNLDESDPLVHYTVTARPIAHIFKCE